jgi:integral membrane protein (TIGR00529 family)
VNPALALVISLVLVLLLLRVKVPTGPAIFTGSVFLSLFTLPVEETPRLMLQALTDLQTLRLLAIVICALTMSHLMEKRGLLTRLADALEGIGPKLAIHVAPAAIGLMPLPGGAVVSATAVKDLVRRLGLAPEQATFINFWFRHICEFATPVYPGIIMAGVFLSVPLSFVLLHLAPIWILMLVFGSIVSWRMLRSAQTNGRPPSSHPDIAKEIFRSAWPVMLVFALVVAGLDAAPAFLVTIVALVLQQRMRATEIKAGVRYGLDPKILFLLYAVMLYKAVVEGSGAAEAMFHEMEAVGMPSYVILTALPILIGFATGLSSAMVGISIPLLMPFIMTADGVNWPAFLLAYGAGGLGYLLSLPSTSASCYPPHTSRPAFRRCTATSSLRPSRS